MTDLRSQLQSTLGDAYTIERELGGGGMSRVFLATERALNRQVVIKILPAETAGAVSIERFKREIGVAARLQQANIVPVLTAGEAGGVPFYTMPYVEGESLRARLAAGVEFTVPEAVGLLKEVARALSYAHGKNVVHRDIKPDNVLLSSGTAMVTDFGIAKALSDSATAGPSTLTGTGNSLGTPAYMAPEQAAADPNVDHRADIYAFGCLAYEILTGAPPFAGESPQATIAAHLTRDPEPIGRKRSGLPDALISLVSRCLAKQPGSRPQSAAEIVSSLEALPSGSNAAGAAPRLAVRRQAIGAAIVVIAAIAVVVAYLRPSRVAGTNRGTTPVSIAVMPLDIRGNDSTTEFFAGALVDRLRGELVRSGLLVAPRGSAQTLKDQKASSADAAKRLHVSAALTGNVERLGSRLRVTLELTDTSGFAVWDRTVEKASTDPMAVEDEIVRELANALRDKFASSLTIAAQAHAPDHETFDLYSRGLYWYRKGSSPEDLAKARNYYTAAIKRDSLFADAYTGLAQAYIWLADAYAAPKQVIPPALAAARRAAALDNRSSEAHSMIGEMLWAYYHDWDGARIELDTAIALDPSNAEPVLWKAWMAITLRDTTASVTLVHAAMRQDPLDPYMALLGPALLSWSSVPDSSLALFARVRASKVVPPDFYYLEAWESEAYRRLGQYDRALAADSGAARALGRPTSGLVLSLAGLGRMAEARRSAQSLADASHANYFLPELVALAWAGVGEKEKALDELERGAANLSGGASYMLSSYREFRTLRGLPRFERLLKQANLSAYYR